MTSGLRKMWSPSLLVQVFGGVWGWMTFWVLTAWGSSNNKVLPGRQSPFINTFVNVAEKNLTLWKIPKSQLLIIMMVFFYMKNILLISIKKLIYKSLGWASCWGEFKKCVNELWSPCRTWVIVILIGTWSNILALIYQRTKYYLMTNESKRKGIIWSAYLC